MTKKLKEHLVALGHNVYSFLPENDYSGAGSSISFGQDIHYRQEGEKAFVVSGTPVDCTMLGIQYLRNHKKIIDIVISGINKGTNLRKIIRYSGTINDAKEALGYNIPTIAISVCSTIDVALLEKGVSAIETIIKFMHKNGRYGESAFGLNINIVNGNEYRCDYEQKYTNTKPPLFYVEMGADKAILKFHKIFKKKPESFMLLDGFSIEDNEVRQEVIKKRVQGLVKQVNNYFRDFLPNRV